jgi:steroid 5-alpha reductase family enzyme
MLPLILFLVLIALLFGLGTAAHVLWWIAIIALVVWLVGFMFRPSGGRWYYW